MMGAGNCPVLTPAHQVVLLTGMRAGMPLLRSPMIWERRRNPVPGKWFMTIRIRSLKVDSLYCRQFMTVQSVTCQFKPSAPPAMVKVFGNNPREYLLFPRITAQGFQVALK